MDDNAGTAANLSDVGSNNQDQNQPSPEVGAIQGNRVHFSDQVDHINNEASSHHPEDEAIDEVHDLDCLPPASATVIQGVGIEREQIDHISSSDLHLLEKRRSQREVLGGQQRILVGSGFRQREFESNIVDNIKEIEEMREFSHGSGGEVIEEDDREDSVT